MDGLSDLWSLFTDMTEVVLQFSGRVEGFLAFITLITSGIREITERTGAYDESISQPQIAILTITLCHFLLGCPILLVDVEKDLLGDL